MPIHNLKFTHPKPIERVKIEKISDEEARAIVSEFVRKKNVEKVEISTVAQKGEYLVVTGICQINIEGHMWAERFEVVIDKKGKIKYTEFWLL